MTQLSYTPPSPSNVLTLSPAIRNILSKITLHKDRTFNDEEKLIISDNIMKLAKFIQSKGITLTSEKELEEIIKSEPNVKDAAFNMTSGFYTVPTSLPPYVTYNPPTNLFNNSTFVADPSAVRYMNVFIQNLPETNIESPWDQTLIDPDAANFADVEKQTFGAWVLRGYPGKVKLRRIRVFLYWNPETLNTNLMYADRSWFAKDAGDQDNPWMIQYQSVRIDRRNNLLGTSNPGNYLLQWNTLAHLDAVSTWTSYGSMNVDYGWNYWSIDMNNNGLDLQNGDAITLYTGERTDERVKKVYISLELELAPVNFNPALITAFSVASATVSAMLEGEKT